MKKTSLVIPYWALGLGGIQVRIVAIIEALFFLYSDIEVFVLLKRKTKYDLELRKHRHLTILYYSDSVYQGEQMRFAWWLVKNIWQIKPTHILTFLNRFSFLAVLVKYLLLFKLSIPRVVLSEEIYTSNYLKQKEKWYWHILVTVSYSLADLVLVLTQAMKLDLVNNFGLAINKVRVVSSWVVVNEVKKIKKQYDGIFIGRLSEEKRVFYLVRLARKIKQLGLGYKIAIVGDGEQREELEKLIVKEKLTKTIKVLGYHEDTLSLLQKSRLLLLPSKNEGLPLVILEANSVAVPVVVSTFMGSNEVVTNDLNGWIFSDLNYVNGVITMMGDKRKLNKTGYQARKLVQEKYSLRNLVEFTRQVIG